ncbi:hypothetical protein K1T71_012723 [Dendrolimus kikuchii]|uniref:Uncharacterized protein n=1 Tax=Dendrolimus kikuchii TaxID=765133 RepID=A0ACC1CK37_9NEOP|nr:hypothetical protein K1T71_012723 [Dendrolimus kikuchii]
MDPQELVPLESGLPRPRQASGRYHLSSQSCYRAPLRICRLLALVIVLPSMFIMVPLYMRYRVFLGQMYPMSMTDMRLIDSKISPTWCQRQVVKSNATFNAFVVPGPPELTEDLVPVSMTRELELEDDMKEYWGFYLLKGSSVTVSACVRWPGASLIMIKGYKHLQECAYIGDDSSEELDEIIEAYELGLLTNTTLTEKLMELNKERGRVNDPETMRRHKPGVSFHDPSNVANTTSSSENVPTIDVTDHDPKELREILEKLQASRQAAKMAAIKNFHLPAHLMALPALHRHRDANVDKNERMWLSFDDIDGNTSQITEPTIYTNPITTTGSPKTIKKILLSMTSENKTYQQEKNKSDSEPTKKMADKQITATTTERLKEVKMEYKTSTVKLVKEEPNSKEVFEDVLKRLQALGDKGKRVLVKLHKTMGVEYHEDTGKSKSDIMSAVTGSGEELDRLRQVLVEAIDEEKTKSQRQQKRRDASDQARAKRELMLGQIQLQKELNEDDEARDYAAEEGLAPDGFAEHHEQINETSPLDMSNSELWSSFSSSEEALLECEGLILNLPLTHHSKCYAEATDVETFAAAKANALTYRVPANGYYFFVFNSENEVQKNYIRAKFDLQKTRYDVARTKLRECTNSTSRCDLPLDIFSSQKVVLEVPLRDNDSLWNEQFVIISECEPRTSIYLACVIAVPVLILIFAFQ